MSTTSPMPGSTTLSEADSKALLGRFGVPLAGERLAGDPEAAVAAADELGYPVVAKLNGERIAHKTERGLVRLNLGDADAVRTAAADLLAAATAADGDVQVLVAPMLQGNRELIAGLSRDPQFGMTVMVGIGGIFAEALADVAIRLVPIERVDAEEMIDELRTQALLGPFRGEPAVDRTQLTDVLLGLSRAAVATPDLVSADLNPLIVVDGLAIAVDALVEVAGLMATAEQFRALFDPRGVVVAGASTHPGKFGFVALHNILANGYAGRVFATNREAAPVLDIETVPSLDDVPAGEADLVFVCTPASTNPDLLRSAAAKGIRAAFLASAGYGEAGEEGRRAQDELVALAEELGILMVGPNGQGVVSTPSSLCAQIVAPYPPPAHRGRQPVGQLRVVVHELRLCHRRRHQPGRVGGQRRHGGRDRLPGLLRRGLRDRCGPGLRRGHQRRPPLLPGDRRGGRADAGRAGQGRGELRRSGPRPATRARWPATTACSTGCAAGG